METREPEVWKPIPGYEGLYEVSSWGSVKSVQRFVNGRSNSLHPVAEKELKINYCGDYPQICLSKNHKKKTYRIHRVMDFVFLDGLLEDYVVNHIDGNKFNNYYKNLERVNRRENSSHFFKSTEKTSMYTGVSYDKSKPKKPWVASIHIEGVTKKVGNLLSEKDAYDVYLSLLEEYGLINKYALLNS
jgi:hypothetical protein